MKYCYEDKNIVMKGSHCAWPPVVQFECDYFSNY